MAFSISYFWLVDLLSSVCMLTGVKSLTSFKGSLDAADADGILVYANFFPFPHHKLNSTPVESRSVRDEDDCIAACTEASRCRSLNFKPVPDANNNFICHLLDTDKFANPEWFHASLDFHHYSFTAPCDHNPCKNGGTCYPVAGEHDFTCACTRRFRGKRCDYLYKNCAELLEGGFDKSGVYQVEARQSEMMNISCDQSSRGGGWTMVFKVVSGVSADIYQLWSSSDSLNEDKTEALNVNTSFRGHYKNRLVPNWQTANPKEVHVALYKDGSQVLSILFNATNTDNENWFNKNRLLQSPWVDMDSEPQNYFSVAGYSGPKRFFYISRNHGGCELDAGWLVVSAGPCSYETRFSPIRIMYSKVDTYTDWEYYENVGIADVFVVFIR